jgi:hypothetical protein
MVPIRSVSQAWPAATELARPRRNTPTVTLRGHGRPARSAPPQRAALRPGGSSLLGAPPPPPLPRPCAGSSLLLPGPGCAPAPPPVPRSPARWHRASDHGQRDHGAVTAAGTTRQSPATPPHRGQCGQTRPGPGRGGGIRVDTVLASADPFGLPDASSLPTRKSAKPGQDQGVRATGGSSAPVNLAGPKVWAVAATLIDKSVLGNRSGPASRLSASARISGSVLLPFTSYTVLSIST